MEETKEQSSKDRQKPNLLLLEDNKNDFTTQNQTLTEQETNNLISLQEAFADDDIAKDFANEKENLLDEAADNKESFMSGWGSWTGPQPIKKLSRRQNRKKKAKERREKIERRDDLAKKRRDFDLDHVIINDEAVKAQLKGLLGEGFFLRNF